MSDDGTEVTKREGADALPVRSSRLSRGTLVGRYIVLDVLGEGGMGVVYSAYDPELDRKIALKLLQARVGGSSGGDQAWLLREAQAMARLAHPNVISVHDVGTLPGDRIFVAMEFVDGETLRRWLEQRRSWREVLPVLRAAGFGLAAAHAAGLVHRDFKPDNVLVARDGRVRVMDFGLARLRQGDDSFAGRESGLKIESRSPLGANLTVEGAVVGTPAYMAPEIYRGVAADARSDQFAFAVALYEALFRVRPFERKQLVEGGAGLRPKPPAADVGVPARIQRVVLRALASDPAARFASMDELLAELAIDPTVRQRRVWLALGGAALMVGAVVVTFAVSSSSPPPCTGTEQRLAGVWDATTRARVRSAFESTGKPYAKLSFAGLERALDKYTGEWTKASVESCRATRIRGDQTEEMMSLRQECLDRRLEGVRALVHLLGEPDEHLVEKGDKVVWELEPLAACSNTVALRSPERPPVEQRDKVREVNGLMLDARVRVIAGHTVQALVSSQKAIDMAKQIGHAPTLAEAMLVRGTVFSAAGNASEALPLFADAAWLALRSRRDDIAATAAVGSATMTSDQLGKPGEAKLWLAFARAIGGRIGAVNRDTEIRIYVAEGIIAAQSNDAPTAIAAHEKALATAEVMFGRDSPALWTYEELLGATLAKAGAYAKAVQHFERALSFREASVGPEHLEVAVILSNLGVAYAHADPKKSRPAYERALAIREKLFGPNNPMLLATLNNMADSMVRHGDASNALVVIERAKVIADKAPGPGHPTYQTIETTRGEVLAALDRFDEARRVFASVLALEQKQGSPVLATTLNSRALMAIRERAWADAESFALRAVTVLEKAGGTDNPELVRPLITLGRARASAKRSAAARAAFERAISLGDKLQLDTELGEARAGLQALPP